MSTHVSALPDRPLTIDEVNALDQHDSLDTCFPVYCRDGSDTDDLARE